MKKKIDELKIEIEDACREQIPLDFKRDYFVGNKVVQKSLGNDMDR